MVSFLISSLLGALLGVVILYFPKPDRPQYYLEQARKPCCQMDYHHIPGNFFQLWFIKITFSKFVFESNSLNHRIINDMGTRFLIAVELDRFIDHHKMALLLKQDCNKIHFESGTFNRSDFRDSLLVGLYRHPSQVSIKNILPV